MAGHGWQGPSPDEGLKVPCAQAEKEKAFTKTFIKNMQLLLRLHEVHRGKTGQELRNLQIRELTVTSLPHRSLLRMT